MYRLGELHLDEDVVKMASAQENKSAKVNESATPRHASAAPCHHPSHRQTLIRGSCGSKEPPSRILKPHWWRLDPLAFGMPSVAILGYSNDSCLLHTSFAIEPN
jgi:hypothetical protein